MSGHGLKGIYARRYEADRLGEYTPAVVLEIWTDNRTIFVFITIFGVKLPKLFSANGSIFSSSPEWATVHVPPVLGVDRDTAPSQIVQVVMRRLFGAKAWGEGLIHGRMRRSSALRDARSWRSYVIASFRTPETKRGRTRLSFSAETNQR